MQNAKAPAPKSSEAKKEDRPTRYGRNCQNACSVVGSYLGFFAGKIHDGASAAYSAASQYISPKK